MDFFKKFVSNSLAGTSNQSYFLNDDPEKINTGRMFYKVFAGGKYSYSFLFSNIIDGSMGNASYSHNNLVCDEWSITALKLYVLESCNGQFDNCEKAYTLHFNSCDAKTVMPGEFFATDPVLLDCNKGDYICLEISFKGKMIPCHPERLIPTYLLCDGRWEPSANLPVAGMVGCDRKVKCTVGYFGDSITQGIGPAANSYEHWSAVLSEKLGADYAFWNLGIGCGRATDAASDGSWLFKAKQTDVVVVCFGVNDIASGSSEKQTEDALLNTVLTLKRLNKKVLLQTVPPFTYGEQRTIIWKNINNFIKNTLSQYADAVFDVVPVLLADEEHDTTSVYGDHPNAEGCKLWAQALYPVLKDILNQ